MTEDKTVGDSLPVESDPPEPSPDPTPDPYTGKTEAELKAMLKDKEKMIGGQAQEVGDSRAKISELENELNYRKQFGPTPEPNPFDDQSGNTEPKPDTDNVPPDYWTNPRKYHSQWAAEDEQKKFAVLQKQDSEIRTNVYKANPVVEQARKETPHVFENVSKKEMDEGIYAWLANKWVHKSQLGDTLSHRRIATWIKGEKSEYNFTTKVTPQNPVQPTATEPYVGTKPPADAANKTPIHLDALGTEFLKHRPKGEDGRYLQTEEEFKDEVRKTQKETGGR